ncbi:MAG: amino-acid N-acetyltransferase [Methylococcus sp.]|nr:amino-acid N-acetyltransferase [Methylococcus sp.]
MTIGIDPQIFVRWLRDSAPYIHAHRNRTFVVSFGGETLSDGHFAPLVHDFALLHSLGIKLVLVHGTRPQVERRLRARGADLHYHGGLRITDAAALECVQEAAGAVRVEIEALLSMGAANSPMAGARIRVASGNFVVAKPLGIRDGVDFGYTGEVRRVDTGAIRRLLDDGSIVLLSPLGYSPTGDIFNLSAEEVATAVASALGADKLVLLMEQVCLLGPAGQMIRQITVQEAEHLLERGGSLEPEVAPHMHAAVKACSSGVTRAHLLDRHIDGAILLELFTRDGVGTLVSANPFEELRSARVNDVVGILDLIRPLENTGALVNRSRERLETEIDDYVVIERDGLIIGCAALHEFPAEAMGEFACLALHPDYRGERRGERLLEFVEQRARRLGLARLCALTTQAMQWFRERGFEPASPAELPAERRKAYNPERNSQVLVKILRPAEIPRKS